MPTADTDTVVLYRYRLAWDGTSDALARLVKAKLATGRDDFEVYDHRISEKDGETRVFFAHEGDPQDVHNELRALNLPVTGWTLSAAGDPLTRAEFTAKLEAEQRRRHRARLTLRRQLRVDPPSSPEDQPGTDAHGTNVLGTP